MESNFSPENELEQLKIISENQEKLLKKLEELEKNDNEEEKNLKYIQKNINNLFELISHSINNKNNGHININTSPALNLINNNDNDNITTNIPIDTQNTENINNNTNSTNIINNIPNNNNTINEILETRDSKILFTVNEFKKFIGSIIDSPSASYRQNIIEKQVKQGYMFSIEQIGELLNLLPYMSEKKCILKLLKNSIHDYYHKQELLNYLTEETEEEKQALFDILFK
ncbi:hypothetical protein BCR32DRAFT_294894 [Anaeromyces robustus]|uniref:DUF4476 domain-containing protein n=1 Tax=Anaeromyces robustus TaxID=1754192 RepID=A0A1Y1WYV4_9FUNG|nr:hypothetical protein BCR32DRAFT_294894 [Anaeromyces robustus]|eukprot:ORX78683.1 hypothetical protein BCR32DRAFT_294894 [Anaeromyces robustus]